LQKQLELSPPADWLLAGHATQLPLRYWLDVQLAVGMEVGRAEGKAVGEGEGD
jgi:hypothetical protein